MLCTQIVLGLNDKDLQSTFPRKDFPLSKLIKYWQTVKQAEMHRRVVQKGNSSLDQIEKGQQFKSKGSKSQIKQNNGCTQNTEA